MDRLIVERKLDSLQRCIRRIRDKRPDSVEALAADADLQDVLVLNLSRGDVGGGDMWWPRFALLAVTYGIEGGDVGCGCAGSAVLDPTCGLVRSCMGWW